MTPSPHQRWPPCSAAVDCHTRRSRRSRGALPRRGGDAAPPACATARHSWRMAPIPRRPLPGQPSASKAPRKPSVQVAPSAVTPRLAPRLWRSTASGSPLTRRGAAPSHAVGATRRSPTRPLPWTSDTPGRVWAPSSVASCSTPCPARALPTGAGWRVVLAPRQGRASPGAPRGRLATRGTAHLPGACAAAATLGLRGHAPGPKARARGEPKPATGNARRLLAPTRARVVSGLRTRPTALALEHGRRPAGSSAGEPGAARATAGMRRTRTEGKPRRARAWHAAGRLGPLSLRPALCVAARSGSGLSGV
jgi:hypothetical protein